MHKTMLLGAAALMLSASVALAGGAPPPVHVPHFSPPHIINAPHIVNAPKNIVAPHINTSSSAYANASLRSSIRSTNIAQGGNAYVNVQAPSNSGFFGSSGLDLLLGAGIGYLVGSSNQQPAPQYEYVQAPAPRPHAYCRQDDKGPICRFNGQRHWWRPAGAE